MAGRGYKLKWWHVAIGILGIVAVVAHMRRRKLVSMLSYGAPVPQIALDDEEATPPPTPPPTLPPPPPPASKPAQSYVTPRPSALPSSSGLGISFATIGASSPIRESNRGQAVASVPSSSYIETETISASSAASIPRYTPSLVARRVGPACTGTQECFLPADALGWASVTAPGRLSGYWGVDGRWIAQSVDVLWSGAGQYAVVPRGL